MIWIISTFMFLISLCSLVAAVNSPSSGSLDSPDKTRDVVDKKELRRIKKMEYQRTYRANHPEKAKATDARSREKRDKDPIRKEKRRIYKLNYYRKRRKEERDKVQQHSQTTKDAKGKRKRIEHDEQVKPTVTRVRTYGKAPKSSAFINPGTSEKHFLVEPSIEEKVVPKTHKFNKPDAKIRISFSPKRLRTTEVPDNHSS